jgi:hypothetical protein
VAGKEFRQSAQEMWLRNDIVIEEEEQLATSFRDHSVAHSGRCAPGEDGYMGVRETPGQGLIRNGTVLSANEEFKWRR